MQKIKYLVLILIFIFTLTGCAMPRHLLRLHVIGDTEHIGDFGTVEYDLDPVTGIVEYKFDPFTKITDYDIENVRMMMDGTRRRSFYIYNLDSELLYQNPDISYFGISYAYSDGKIHLWDPQWEILYRTLWGTYIDGYLESGKLITIDGNTGEELYTNITGEDELFLTVEGNKAYFYHRGYNKDQGMLWWKEDKNATLYYRELDNFEEKTIVHTFDFDGTLYESEVDFIETVGVDISFLEISPYKFEDYLIFDITDDAIDVSYEYQMRSDYIDIITLWTTTIPFAEDVEVTTEYFDTKINFDKATTSKSPYQYDLENITLTISEKLQYFPQNNLFITDDNNYGFYRVNEVEEFELKGLYEDLQEDEFAILGNWRWKKGYNGLLEYYYTGYEYSTHPRLESICLKKGVTNEGVEYKYNFLVEDFDSLTIDKGFMGYVYFGKNSPVEIFEISGYFNSDTMSDEEMIKMLEDMINSIEFRQ